MLRRNNTKLINIAIFKMKRVFSAIIIAASIVGCGRVDNSMYFDTSDKRVYEDPAAEFDTLSYAVGMNLGLGIRFQPSGMTFDYNALITALEEEMAKPFVNFEELEANKDVIKRFSAERLQPYALANFARKNQTSSNSLTNETPLFNEEFTQEGVSAMYGRDMVNYIVTAAYPLNMYWLRTAMDEAVAIEGENVEIHDSLMRLSVVQMRGSLQNYHSRIHPVYVANAAKEWLGFVAQQPNVNAMVVDEFDTLYYRVNRAGNGVKPRGLNDTISFSYDLYTRSGKLVESHSKRADIVREALEAEKAADTIPDSKRVARIKQLTDQLNSIENLRIPLSKSLLKGLKYAVQNVGEGGEITVWMPASLAFGERGNRIVHGNDAVVMNVHLKSVSYGPADEELAAVEEEKPAHISIPKIDKGEVVTPEKKPEPLDINKIKKFGTSDKIIVRPVEKK